MDYKNQIEKVAAYPYEITLIKRRDAKAEWRKAKVKKNCIEVFYANRNHIYVSAKIYDEVFVQPMGNWKPLSDLSQSVISIVNEKAGKKRKLQLYDLLVDILEVYGCCPPVVENNYELIHNHAHWVEVARNYYFAAKILERHYVNVMKMDRQKKRRSKKLAREFEQAYSTNKVIIYLYSRVIECILKSRIYYKIECVFDYLTEKKRIYEKRQVKKWIEKNIHTHDLIFLSEIACCKPRKKSEINDYGQITGLLLDGKYPGPKKDVLYSGIASGGLEKDVLEYVNKTKKGAVPSLKTLLAGERLFEYFDHLTISAVDRCYGRMFSEHFSEWHRPKIIRRMTAFSISYNKEVRERNDLIRLIMSRTSSAK